MPNNDATISDIVNDKYYIYDSNINYATNTIPAPISSYKNLITSNRDGSLAYPNLSGNASSSFISIQGNITNANYDKKGPYNLLTLQNEVAKRLSLVVNAFHELSSCNRITQYVIANNPPVWDDSNNNPFLNENAYTNNFKGHNCNIFQNVASATNNAYSNSVGANSQIPIFTPDVYGATGTPLAYGSSKTITKYPDFSASAVDTATVRLKDGTLKNIATQICDVNNLMNNLSAIVQWISKSQDSTILSNSKSNLKDIIAKENENIALRNDLDNKVAEILKVKNSYYGESKQHLDTTIYANIMWTVLATSILYFIFAKL
jgi:hypothetical protein